MSTASKAIPLAPRPLRARTFEAGASHQVAKHNFDGGRSRSVRQGLQPLLEEARGRLEADIAIAVHGAVGGRLGVLAASGERAGLLPLVNEEVRLTDSVGRPLKTTEPMLAHDIIVTSMSRPFRLECSSAILVPWSDGNELGTLVIGVAAGVWSDVDFALARRYSRQLGALHRDASFRGTVRLADDLAAACKAIDHAELDATGSGEFFVSIAGIARSLMGTPTAYIAMPEDGAAGAFPFTTLVGIRTSAFRRLRMGREQGLGGFARREGVTVHTTHYSGDRRLQHAPVKETLDEGIVSAICTPLIVDGQIAGTLYLGERQPRAFSATDTDLLSALAEHIGLCLNRQNIEEYRRSVLRNRERDRLAAAMHDSVVRSLVEIGYHAEEGVLRNPDQSLRRLLEAISTAASSALDQVRSELFAPRGNLHAEREQRAGELVETLRLVPRRPEVKRTFKLDGLDRDTVLPLPIFEGLASAGEEALVNSEVHSGCSAQEVRVERSAREVRLVILDNGCGIEEDVAEAALAKRSGHLGLRNMRAAAMAQGGQTTFAKGPDGRGTVVTVRIPLRQQEA